MIVKNLTSKQQKIEVKEISGEHRKYDIFIAPEGFTDIDNHFVFDINKYAGVLEIEGRSTVSEVVTPLVTPLEAEDTVPVEDATPEEIHEDKEIENITSPEAFICELCGAEFASARGLSSHKNKAHAE